MQKPDAQNNRQESRRFYVTEEAVLKQRRQCVEGGPIVTVSGNPVAKPRLGDQKRRCVFFEISKNYLHAIILLEADRSFFIVIRHLMLPNQSLISNPRGNINALFCYDRGG